MGQILYQRPREKLRSQGVQALTSTELLQLIIGSGSAKVSGAKLARMVEQVLATGVVSYEALVAVRGVGEAKACQVLAVVELGKRLNLRE